jgi:hypothetical protein
MSIEAMKQALEALEEINKLSIGEGAICLPAEIDTAMDALRQAIEQAEKQVVFKIYKPTLPRGAIPNVRDAELPWVYDQDPWSGNVASMWVTPVKAAPQPQQEPVKMVAYNCLCGRIMKFESVNGIVAPQREWVGLTDEDEIDWDGGDLKSLVKAIEAKLRSKNT